MSQQALALACVIYAAVRTPAESAMLLTEGRCCSLPYARQATSSPQLHSLRDGQEKEGEDIAHVHSLISISHYITHISALAMRTKPPKGRQVQSHL